MRNIIFNDDNLIDEDMEEFVIRCKGLIVNDDNILLGYSFHTYQFPGGHLEDGESIYDCLIREIREETGILVEESNCKLFEKITYYYKEFFKSGKNRKNELYYFIVDTNDEVNLNNITLTDVEKKGNYQVVSIPINTVEQVLIDSIPDNPINEIIVNEMLDVIKEYKNILVDLNLTKNNIGGIYEEQ